MAKKSASKSKAKKSDEALILAKPPSAMEAKKVAKSKPKKFIKRSERGA